MNDSRFSITPAGKLSLKGKDRGFTIIELLVVMAIIGLLAAIAIPVFQNLKNNAYDSAAQSDLRAAVIAIETEHSQAADYPATLTETQLLADPYDVKKSQDAEVFTYTKVGAGYTLEVTSRSGVDFTFTSATGSIAKA